MTVGHRVTNEEFFQKLDDENIKYIPLEEFNGMSVKIKWLCFNNLKHIFEATPSNVIGVHSGCPYCSGTKVFRGETDLWTTHPDVAEMLVNQEDGYLYSYGSSHKEDWICPDCGAVVYQRTIKSVVAHGFRCPNCVRTISYPEKFLSSFLNQLDIVYIYDKATNWSNLKRYDFYIPNLSLIIECHGEQHYKTVRWGKKYIDDQSANDEYKKNLAINNGIQHYIQLDCSHSDFKHIKSSILSSDLFDIFNLSSFDWDLCEANICKAKNSYYGDILDLLSNYNMKPSEIADKLKIGQTTVYRYIHRLNEAGLIEYKPNHFVDEYIQNLSKPVRCVETGEIFPSICAAARSINGNDSAISKCCRGMRKTYRGYHWEFYYDEVVV